jgi:hypothetical protein
LVIEFAVDAGQTAWEESRHPISYSPLLRRSSRIGRSLTGKDETNNFGRMPLPKRRSAGT